MSSIAEQNLSVLAPSFTTLVLEMYAVSLSHNFYMTLSYNMIIILVYIHFESAQKFLQFQITIHTVGISGLCMTTQCHRLLQLVGFPFSLFLFPGFILQPCNLFCFFTSFHFSRSLPPLQLISFFNISPSYLHSSLWPKNTNSLPCTNFLQKSP